ncbi:hypothetical protein FA13DRAFT_1776456 [Coprinellus micaceus]|uniref:Uncharacterized protein n=1 Tax=Coprinellus micaceus TaxID=71717 RepID=A0A4Y7SZW8_COPMI|nr:hypothetical protein FA13DRAFT_1776456 [Coprinellus micaceus]
MTQTLRDSAAYVCMNAFGYLPTPTAISATVQFDGNTHPTQNVEIHNFCDAKNGRLTSKTGVPACEDRILVHKPCFACYRKVKAPIPRRRNSGSKWGRKEASGVDRPQLSTQMGLEEEVLGTDRQNIQVTDLILNPAAPRSPFLPQDRTCVASIL